MVLTVVFALLNLLLGFALAVYMESGLAGFREVWKALSGSRIRIATGPAIAPSPSFSNPTSGIASDSKQKLTDNAGAGNLGNGINAPKGDFDFTAELLEPSSQESFQLDEKYVETSILRLNIAMTKSSTRANQIDNRLRESHGNSDPEVIEACVRLLRDDCVAYLAEQTEAADNFHNRISEFGKLSAMCEEIEMTNLEQSAQVETTINNLQYMDFHTNPEEANLRLIEEIKNLNSARHKLRDQQEAAFLTVARHENRLDQIEKRLFPDALTKLRNRIGLETMLFDWWQKKLHETRPLIAVLLDINSFGVVNHKFGLVVGDQIIYQLAQFLQTSISKTDVVGRYSGQQFLVMLTDAGSSAALKNVDLWRQTIEKIVFMHEDQPVRITISAAITLVAPTDAYHEVLERLENIIQQVKQAGPNKIFFHNGAKTAPLETHSLGLQEKQIVL
jgi:diguanylate cyclase (GGDEF)-like protein